jgi:hypothetical protein
VYRELFFRCLRVCVYVRPLLNINQPYCGSLQVELVRSRARKSVRELIAVPSQGEHTGIIVWVHVQVGREAAYNHWQVCAMWPKCIQLDIPVRRVANVGCQVTGNFLLQQYSMLLYLENITGHTTPSYEQLLSQGSELKMAVDAKPMAMANENKNLPVGWVDFFFKRT